MLGASIGFAISTCSDMSIAVFPLPQNNSRATPANLIGVKYALCYLPPLALPLPLALPRTASLSLPAEPTPISLPLLLGLRMILPSSLSNYTNVNWVPRTPPNLNLPTLSPSMNVVPSLATSALAPTAWTSVLFQESVSHA